VNPTLGVFTKGSRITGQITDVTCNNTCAGSIQATGNIFLGAPKYYEIYPPGASQPSETINITGANSATFHTLCPGVYTVKYYADVTLMYMPGEPPVTILSSVSKTFEVAYMPDWVNNANVTINPTDRSLTKTSGLSQLYTWDAGASSLNTLKAADNGWIEWTASNSGAVNGIGFSSTDANTDINTINYGVGFIEFAKYYILTNNQRIVNAMSTSNARGNYTDNAVFRLEKNSSANTISFLVNGVVKGTFPITSQDLILDASMQFLNGVIKHPRVSFGCGVVFPPSQNYFILKKTLDGGYYASSNQKIYFAFEEEYFDPAQQLTYKIVDDKNSVISSLPNKIEKIGDNRYQLDLASIGLSAGKFYRISITNKKNEVFHARFKY
ncbi:MAG TPA: hypothetical protein VGF30_16530, partial [Bacteroidia bacterium]